jgi:hypothetical protein
MTEDAAVIEFDCEGCGRPIYLYGARERPANVLCGACGELDRCYRESNGRMTLAQFLAIYDRICRA